MPGTNSKPRLTARAKIGRDNEIVAARMRGMSWMTIPATYGLSERQCQTIMREHRESSPRLRERDPIELVDEMLDPDRADARRVALVVVERASPHSTRKRVC
jgi:hypothetical protein